MEQIKTDSGEWQTLLNKLATEYKDGKTIPHEWLRRQFGLESLKYEDFENQEDFIEALKQQQFSYMSLCELLRTQLLKNESLYMKTVIGAGFRILKSEEQTRYGYDEFIRDVKKAIRQADMIMTHVRPVPFEQKAKDDDIRAKTSILKQMLTSVK